MRQVSSAPDAAQFEVRLRERRFHGRRSRTGRFPSRRIEEATYSDETGLLKKVGGVSVDGTKIKASASRNANVARG